MSKSNEELAEDLVEVRQAIRDLYALEQRFKPASFGRSPMPALQRVLTGEVAWEEPRSRPEKVIDVD